MATLAIVAGSCRLRRDFIYRFQDAPSSENRLQLSLAGGPNFGVHLARQLSGYELLLTIPGFGKILAMTIAMEIVSIERFSSAEHFASYARMVPAIKKSNNRKKGDNNRRCGNRYLGWAFIEAANIHCRFSDVAKRWHDRKKAKTCKAVAVKALGCKLAKAVWHVLHEQVPYDESRVFGPQKTNSKAV